MNSRYIKMPDGRYARPQISQLEQYLRERQLPSPAARERGPSRWQSHPQREDHSAEPDLQSLFGSEVILFGAASVGSHLAYFLTVASLIPHVVDFKKVERKHLHDGRTRYTRQDLGLLKVDALKRGSEANHLGTQVRAYPSNAAQFTTSDLRAMFRRCLIVLLAIDDPERILRIADLAYPVVELLQVAMHARGHSSHIAISIPLVTPCLRCTLRILNPHDIRRLDREASSSGDIVTLANTAANFALDLK